VYYNKDQLQLYIKPTDGEIDDVIKQIEDSSKKIDAVHFTGGRAYELHKKYSKKYKSTLVDEFEANINGIDLLYMFKKQKTLFSSLIVTIGTGTSIVKKDKLIEHIGGSSLGGGVFMALMKLLFNLEDYSMVVRLASKGNRYNVDLKVSDIYSKDDNRIDDIFKEFTAASLGKISTPHDLESIKKEDIIQSILYIIGESIGILSACMAEIHNLSQIIYCGGLLIDNKVLKNVLKTITRIKKQKAFFLNNSEFAGAIGTLLT